MERENLLLITVIVILVLLFSYFFFDKYKQQEAKKHLQKIMEDKKLMDEKVNDSLSKDKNYMKKIVKKECKIGDLNSDKCLKTKVENSCPPGCYKQCTNNNKPVLESCDCLNRNSMLCKSNKKLSEKCLDKNDMLMNTLVKNDIVKGKDTKLRINNYTAKISSEKKCSCDQEYKSLRLTETPIRTVGEILACKK